MPRGWVRLGIGCLPRLWWWCVQGARAPVFCFCSWLLRRGSFVSYCPQFTPVTHAQLFLVSCSFSVFCCWGTCLCRCKHHSKGSQVSVPTPSKECRGHWFCWPLLCMGLKAKDFRELRSMCSTFSKQSVSSGQGYSYKKTL